MSMEEVLTVLRNSVAQPKGSTLTTAEYLGSVGERFEIYRNIKGRNTFLPMLKGRVTSLSNGTEIVVRFGISWWVVAFCSGFLVLAFAIPHRIALPEEGGWIVLFAFVVMFAVGFFSEAERSERDLKRMIPPNADSDVGR